MAAMASQQVRQAILREQVNLLGIWLLNGDFQRNWELLNLMMRMKILSWEEQPEIKKEYSQRKQQNKLIKK